MRGLLRRGTPRPIVVVLLVQAAVAVAFFAWFGITTGLTVLVFAAIALDVGWLGTERFARKGGAR